MQAVAPVLIGKSVQDRPRSARPPAATHPLATGTNITRTVCQRNGNSSGMLVLEVFASRM